MGSADSRCRISLLILRVFDPLAAVQHLRTLQRTNSETFGCPILSLYKNYEYAGTHTSQSTSGNDKLLTYPEQKAKEENYSWRMTREI
jgi:hypothetical protein